MTDDAIAKLYIVTYVTKSFSQIVSVNYPGPVYLILCGGWGISLLPLPYSIFDL